MSLRAQLGAASLKHEYETEYAPTKGVSAPNWARPH